jgi:flagellar basal body P-ring formation chaperone FlgA
MMTMSKVLSILLMTSALLMAQEVKIAPSNSDSDRDEPPALTDDGALRKRIVEALVRLSPELKDNVLSEKVDAHSAPPAAHTAEVFAERWRWDAIQNRVELRMRCRIQHQCLPFLAYVSVRNPGEIRNQAAATHGSATSDGLAVKPGEHALLTLQLNRFKISTPVICLNAGRPGQIIRVRNPENQRILRAVVVGRGRVQPQF